MHDHTHRRRRNSTSGPAFVLQAPVDPRQRGTDGVLARGLRRRPGHAAPLVQRAGKRFEHVAPALEHGRPPRDRLDHERVSELRPFVERAQQREQPGARALQPTVGGAVAGSTRAAISATPASNAAEVLVRWHHYIKTDFYADV